VAKRDEDLKYMSARLLLFEQFRGDLTRMKETLPRHAAKFDEALRVLNIEIENLEHCLRRDRINHQKPE
jgi:hypothetical protein